MSYRAYYPDRGDLVHVNFSPSAGREMADRHYALVLSSITYHRKTGLAIVCPITSRIRGNPFEVVLPSNLLPPKSGVGLVESVILADAVRQIGYRERECAFVSKSPTEIVQEVLDKLLAVLE